MKNYPNIISKVYEEPWLITPAKHRAIQKLLETRLEGGDIVVDPDEMEEPEMGTEGTTAIIPIHGIIGKHLSMLEMMCGGCDLDVVNDMLDAANSDSKIERIALDFRSPGGTVTGIPETARKIASLSKPSIAFSDSECCSAAYWLASQAQQFYVTESADVGSIGVYMAWLDRSRQLENAGIKVNAISAGKYKLAGAPFKPLTDEERAMFQASVDKIHEQFKAAVRRHREIPNSAMEGQVYDGEQAVELGLVDGVVDDITEALDSDR